MKKICEMYFTIFFINVGNNREKNLRSQDFKEKPIDVNNYKSNI